MKNWKTTLAGLIGAVALTLQDLFATGSVDTKTIISAVVVAALGYLSKDYNVTGAGK